MRIAITMTLAAFFCFGSVAEAKDRARAPRGAKMMQRIRSIPKRIGNKLDSFAERAPVQHFLGGLTLFGAGIATVSAAVFGDFGTAVKITTGTTGLVATGGGLSEMVRGFASMVKPKY